MCSFSNGGGKPEGKEGAQHSHIRYTPLLLNNEYCAPFLRVSPATVPPERAPTVAGGHLRRSGTSASDAPPLRRRNVMPLAMRPLREQTAHCRRTPVLPSALTRSPPVAAPTPNKFPSGIGEFVFVTLTGLQGFSRLTYPAERRYFDEEQERHSVRGCVAYFSYVSSRGRVPDAVIRKIAPFSRLCKEATPSPLPS